jgi:DNA-binding MarR family transcriptional regulator
VAPNTYPIKGEKTAASAAILFGTPERRVHLCQMAESIGFRIIDQPKIEQSTNFMGQTDLIDLFLIDLTSKSDRKFRELSNIARYLEERLAMALIWTDMAGLEEAYAILPIRQCHFQVGASDVEALLIMSGAARRGNMEQLYDNSREGEFGALHRISDELAGFARALAQIAEKDEAPLKGLAERPVSFRPAPVSYMQPFIEAPKVIETAITAEFVREVIKLRRMRDNHFASDLFADPAWDILLDLLASRLESRTVSVSSLCIAAAVPATTALRWITGMTESGILMRRMDPKDARRVFIELSDDVTEKLLAYFKEVKRRSGLSI